MSIQNLVGQTLGQYELRALLGAGGMGAVYRAYQANLRRDVAVKVLPPSLADQTGYIERFTREAQIAASLEHSHIVPVYDYGTQRGISYVVMRLLTGGSLAQRLTQALNENRPLPSLDETARLLSQLASALDYAHERDVIHRDIKPGNIMFDNQGMAFLVDFGIAKLTSATALTGSATAAIGTPSYMAPEQWRGDKLTPAADQYALAVVIYHMLAGRLPLEADTPYALMHKHLNEPPTPVRTWRSDVPPAVEIVLGRALAKAPEERFPNVTAFADAFRGAVGNISAEGTQFFTFQLRHPRTGGATPTPSAMRSTIQRPSARRSALWLTGLMILLVVAAIGYLLGQGGLPMGGSTPTSLPVTNTPTDESGDDTGIVIVPTADSAGTQVAVSTDEAAPTDEATPTPAATDAPTDTETATDAPTTTNTATDVPTGNPTSTETDAGEISIVILTPDDKATEEATAALVAQAATETTAATDTDTPEPTATDAPTDTPTPTDTDEPTETATSTDTDEPTETATDTPTDTPTPGESDTPTLSARELALATRSSQQTATATLWTETPTPSDTPVPSETPTPDLQQTIDAELTALYLEDLTATATLWTPTPLDTPTATPDERQTLAAELTALYVEDMTATASVWTATPLPTNTPLPTDTPTPTPTQRSIEIADAQITEVVVSSLQARNYTNIYLRAGQRVVIEYVSGSWRAGPLPIWPMVGPEGDPQVASKPSFPVSSAPIMSLIAGLDESTPVVVGQTYEIVAQRDGVLWLGANDDDFSDNSGSLMVRIYTPQVATPLPTPTVFESRPIQIAFSSNRDGDIDIFVMNVDGSNLVNLTQHSAVDDHPAWSPDGEQIAFSSNRDSNFAVYVMDADGSNPRNLSNTGANDFLPAWSPDGSQIAFVSDRDGNFEIYVMNADGTNQRRLTNNRAEDFKPYWSPDGEQITFSSNRDGNFEIYVMNADGTNQRNLTLNSAWDYRAVWSPNGAELVFESDRHGNVELYLMSAEGGAARRITNSETNDFVPAWSSDGTLIAFSSDRDGDREIYIVNAARNNLLVQLTNNTWDDAWPSWSPSQPGRE